MRWFAAMLALCVACSGDSPTGEIEYRVERYDARIDLTQKTATIGAIVDVEVGGDCLTIPSRAAPVAARWNDGQPRSGDFRDGTISLCGAGVDAGDDLVIEVDTSLTEDTWEDLQVGFSISDDIEGQPFQYLVSWVGGCDRFGPCDNAPDRFASYRFEVVHDPAETVLCSGTITSEPGLTICETDYRAPTYSTFGLAASRSWTAVDLGSWGGIPVTFYDMPSSATVERVRSDIHSQFMDWLSERFGPYPFGQELRLAVGPTVWNGFEHPDNILLNDDLRNDPLGGGYEDRLTHTINHEIAHMWAGNRTTLASEKDFVWKEATVEYLTMTFEDEVVGASTARRTALAWKTFSRGAQFFPIPTEGAALIDYYGDSYGPGPMILFRQLEALFDRDSVLAALATVLQSESAISVEDIRLALEEQTGANLSGYFDSWLRGSGSPVWPTFAVSFEQDGDQVTVTVDQLSPAKPMGCAFAVELQGPADEVAEVWIDRGVDGQMSTQVVATVAFAVEGTRLDPHGHCLAYGPGASERHSPRNPWRAR
ncbi:MAG: hypothetical protein KJO07_17190 [Deltaproteobacteria bacterium]|jgi:aminopeptidase N|nr:hypothetical protein [Deltaproteobacteria bacterium]